MQEETPLFCSKLPRLAPARRFPSIWTRLAPDDSTFMLRDISIQEIYAIEVQKSGFHDVARLLRTRPVDTWVSAAAVIRLIDHLKMPVRIHEDNTRSDDVPLESVE